MKWTWPVLTQFAKKTTTDFKFWSEQTGLNQFCAQEPKQKNLHIEIIPYSSTCSKLLHHCQKTKNKLCSFK